MPSRKCVSGCQCKRHSTHNKGQFVRDSLAQSVEKFWSQVYKTDDHWYWNGPVGHNGYGQFSNDQFGTVRPHRISWILKNGLIQKDLEIDHICRVRLCVRPDHLEPVSSAENVRRSSVAKLTSFDVLRIRQLCQNGISQRDIAIEYEVHPSQISRINSGKRWCMQ